MVTSADVRRAVLESKVDLGEPGRVAAEFVRVRQQALVAGTFECLGDPPLINGEWRTLKRDLVRCHLAAHGEVCPGVNGAVHPWRTNWSIDHVVPKSLGGTNDPMNLDVVCQRCNERRMPWALWWYVLAEDFGRLGVSAEAERLRTVFQKGVAILEPETLMALLGSYEGGSPGWKRILELVA